MLIGESVDTPATSLVYTLVLMLVSVKNSGNPVAETQLLTTRCIVSLLSFKLNIGMLRKMYFTYYYYTILFTSYGIVNTVH